MCRHTHKLLVVFISILQFCSADIPLYARCFANGTIPGLCTYIRECKPIFDQLNSGTTRSDSLAFCSHKDNTICCPRNYLNKKQDFRANSFSDKNENSDRKIVVNEDGKYVLPQISAEKIADKKCREYESLTVSTVFFSGNALGSRPIEEKQPKCTRDSMGLIHGGEKASRHEFPHQALLGYTMLNVLRLDKIKWRCGGSLISNEFVLTAGHCLVFNNETELKYVKLGMIIDSESGDYVQIINVAKTFRHPDFSLNPNIADIGLIKLDRKVDINEFILPVCLPTKLYLANKAVVAGFGSTGVNKSSEFLLKVALERFNHTMCQEYFQNFLINERSILCYGDHTGMKDSCRGDSGGPLIISNHDVVSCTFIQIGLVSFGKTSCEKNNKIAGYTNVYHYLDWIVGIVWRNEPTLEKINVKEPESFLDKIGNFFGSIFG